MAFESEYPTGRTTSHAPCHAGRLVATMCRCDAAAVHKGGESTEPKCSFTQHMSASIVWT